MKKQRETTNPNHKRSERSFACRVLFKKISPGFFFFNVIIIIAFCSKIVLTLRCTSVRPSVLSLFLYLTNIGGGNIALSEKVLLQINVNTLYTCIL